MYFTKHNLTNLSSQIFLEGEEAQVSCLLEVVGSQTEIPKSLEKKSEILEGRGGG